MHYIVHTDELYIHVGGIASSVGTQALSKVQGPRGNEIHS